ncbi:hypothetical protein L1987_81401 [Smallanthus sonchifolius]|uniref:Uncharacterized protein n=1 Tax=Smallanthus sonchifolius TaxID=185202 RepID=A0ACB8YUK9_9ASTR|nr:hypothetical protein L1987_81401 [Smallanthus sonchifolius]
MRCSLLQNRYTCDDCAKEAKHMKHVFLVELYMKLESGRWPLILSHQRSQKSYTIKPLGTLSQLDLVVTTEKEMVWVAWPVCLAHPLPLSCLQDEGKYDIIITAICGNDALRELSSPGKSESILRLN